MTDIPRKLSVSDNHPLAPRLRIQLDGVEQRYVIAYDIDAGIVERCKLDADGHVYAEGDEIVRETVSGVVTVELRAE
jgi:hypothetical protein